MLVCIVQNDQRAIMQFRTSSIALQVDGVHGVSKVLLASTAASILAYIGIQQTVFRG